MSDLPEPGTPLELADGRKIDPQTGRVISHYIEVPRHSEAQALVTSARRKLVDLPDEPQRMNVISAVASYHLFGLDDDEIAVALQIKPDQVRQIRSRETFSQFTDAILQRLVERDADTIRGVLAEGSRSAATRVRQLVNSDDDSIALAASRDLLDRSGHRPVDVVEHRHQMEGGLTIRVIDDGPTPIDNVEFSVEGDD